MDNIRNKILPRVALLSVMLMALSMPSIGSAQAVVGKGLLRAMSEKVWTKPPMPSVPPIPSVTTTIPSVTSIIPSVTSTIPSVTATVPSVTAIVPSVTTTIPSVTSIIPPVIVIKPSATVENLFKSAFNNRFGQWGCFSSDSTAFNWQSQYGFSAGSDRARAMQNALLGRELTECLSLMITRVDSALISNEYNCEQLDVLQRLSCYINDVLKGDQNELFRNVQGVSRLLDESVALLREKKSDDFLRFLEAQSHFIKGGIYCLKSLRPMCHPSLGLESGINDGIQIIEQEDKDSDEP